MKKLFALIAAMVPALAIAAGGSNIHLDEHKTDLYDKASLQRGAQVYMNYCMGCHSLEHSRYNRVAKDLDIPEELMMENLVFPDTKIGSLMTNAMRPEDGKVWFGATPPDLTLVARVRRPDWLYTYLRSFYEDPSRPWGVNNAVFKDVGMPHVLQNLQGTRTLDENGNLTPAVGGSMTEADYDAFVRDLTNFLEYGSEPNKLERKSLGYWVIGFLLVFFVLSYFLKKEYWKDVH